MARINIEDKLFKDRRFFKLTYLLGGDMDRALGAMVRAWMLAQQWYLSPERMIPAAEWVKQEIPDAIIDAGLAVRVDDKVRLCGSDEQFKWLDQRVKAGRAGGLESAAQRAIRNHKDFPEATAKQIEAKASKPNPPFSISFSNSFSKKEEECTELEISSSGAAIPPPPSDDPIIDELKQFDRAAIVLKHERVSRAAQRAWLDAYQDPGWICSEIMRAQAWIAVNPRKRPKVFQRFMGSWLSRGWEDHRKSIPSNKPQARGIEEILNAGA